MEKEELTSEMIDGDLEEIQIEFDQFDYNETGNEFDDNDSNDKDYENDNEDDDETGNEEEDDEGMEMELEEELGATKKMNRKDPSPVWLHGGKKVGSESHCRLCDYTSNSKRSNTSNLINHIMTEHRSTTTAKELKKAIAVKSEKTKKKKEASKKNAKKQSTVLTFFKGQGQITKRKKEKMDEALVEHFVCSNSPFSEADEQTFRKLIFEAEPNYIVPGAKKVVVGGY